MNYGKIASQAITWRSTLTCSEPIATDEKIVEEELEVKQEDEKEEEVAEVPPKE